MSVQWEFNNMPQLAGNVNNALKTALTQAALRVQGSAKDLCPVDTGNLKASISHEVGDDEARVGTNVEYAPYVEMGTVKMAAQPYLYPGLHQNKAFISQTIGKVAGDAARRTGR